MKLFLLATLLWLPSALSTLLLPRGSPKASTSGLASRLSMPGKNIASNPSEQSSLRRTKSSPARLNPTAKEPRQVADKRLANAQASHQNLEREAKEARLNFHATKNEWQGRWDSHKQANLPKYLDRSGRLDLLAQTKPIIDAKATQAEAYRKAKGAAWHAQNPQRWQRNAAKTQAAHDAIRELKEGYQAKADLVKVEYKHDNWQQLQSQVGPNHPETLAAKEAMIRTRERVPKELWHPKFIGKSSGLPKSFTRSGRDSDSDVSSGSD